MRRARITGLALGLGCLLLLAVSACNLKRTGPSLPPQSTAPVAMLESTMGPQNTQEALARGPLVLVFYRGHW